MTTAETLQRSQQGFTKVAARSTIGRRSKSVIASLLSMHTKLAATDFDHRLVAKVF